MGLGGIAPTFADARKKKYSHDIRDEHGNPIGTRGGGGIIGGQDGQESVFAMADSLASQYENAISEIQGMDGTSTSSADIGRGGAGLTTYGWKMFEDEEKDRIMREKDSQEILEKLLAALRAAAQSDQGGVAELLRAHPQLTESLSGALLNAASQSNGSDGSGWAGGMGVASSGGAGGGGGGGGS